MPQNWNQKKLVLVLINFNIMSYELFQALMVIRHIIIGFLLCCLFEKKTKNKKNLKPKPPPKKTTKKPKCSHFFLVWPLSKVFNSGFCVECWWKWKDPQLASFSYSGFTSCCKLQNIAQSGTAVLSKSLNCLQKHSLLAGLFPQSFSSV